MVSAKRRRPPGQGSKLIHLEKSSIDRFRFCSSAWMHQDADRHVEMSGGTPSAHYGPFDTRFFGLTGETPTSAALAGLDHSALFSSDFRFPGHKKNNKVVSMSDFHDHLKNEM